MPSDDLEWFGGNRDDRKHEVCVTGGSGYLEALGLQDNLGKPVSA